MKPAAYEGDLPYIFVSYSHLDTETVFKILDELYQRGYHIWYDEGIAPGSEWPEEVASHLYHSAMFIAFVSNNSMQSENCRREINFALSKGKPLLSIILEKTDIPLGIEMQLSSHQNILLYNFETWDGFIKKILACPHLELCKGEPNEQLQSGEAPQAASPDPNTDSEADQEEQFKSLIYQSTDYHMKERYQEELDVLLRAQKIKPDNIHVLVKLGRVHRCLGDNIKAMEFYNKAKDMNPRDPTIYVNMASVYVMSGDYANGKPLYEQALDLIEDGAPATIQDKAAIYANYAICIGKLGNIKVARKYLIKARRNGYDEKTIIQACNTLNLDPESLYKKFFFGK